MKAYEFLNILEKRFPNKLVYKRLSNDFEIESLISNTNLADLFANQNKGFIALKGKNDPLESFIHKILEIKPVLIISDKNCNYHKVPSDINLIVFEDLKQDLAEVLRIFYGDPKLNLFGVTGTNGKTTITTLLYNIFVNLSKEDPNFSAGLIGTIKYSFNGLDLLKSSISTIPLTTPDIATNYHLLNLFHQKNVKNVFMEVSSHSLDQGRIEGLNFSITAFTNLSQDHLDYHKTMQNYFEAKKKLFFCYSSNFKIINTYNYYGRILYRELVKKNFKNLINFTIRDSKTFFENERFYSYFTLSFYDPLRNELITEKVETDLIGRYNFENLSIVFITIYFLVSYFLDLGDRRGYYLARAKELIRYSSSFWRDLGRLELISYSPFVFVDYAHTPDALKKVLKSLRKISKGRLIVVFGAGGDRDKSKRPKMGKISSQFADTIILTSDNPRNEDPLSIINDIKKGITPDFSNLITEPDRKKAIELAIELANKQDVILIAGKGHENYQIIGNQKIPFNDKEIATNFLSTNFFNKYVVKDFL